MRGTLFRLRLSGGRTATVSLTSEATVLAVDEETVSSYDLEGRPFAIVREGSTLRRALDGGLLLKRPSEGKAERVRRRLRAEEGAPFVEAARREAWEILKALPGGGIPDPPARGEAERRLGAIVSMDAAGLAADAARFTAVYGGRIGILPPDLYLSLVLRLTEGCSWNACTFCSLYRGVPFRVKTAAGLAEHIAAVRAYFGPAVALRRTLFLGDANALCVGHDRLLPLLDLVARAFPRVPAGLRAGERREWLRAHPEGTGGLYAFVDAWTGHRKRAAEYRAYAERGLARVYVGLESGDPELLAGLEKAGSPDDAVALVHSLKEAGVAVGVIVLLGAGGERFFDRHVGMTAERVRRMELGPEDLLYFSELREGPGLDYGRRASSADLRGLPPDRCAHQRRALLQAIGPWASPPRIATYDIREFVY